jgi:hypothetical protein
VKSVLLGILAYKAAGTMIGAVLLPAGRLTRHAGGSVGTSRDARVISDRERAVAAQADDWHDLIGHHRYYGRSAYGSPPIT